MGRVQSLDRHANQPVMLSVGDRGVGLDADADPSRMLSYGDDTPQ